MKRDIGLYLEDILASIKRIEDYTHDLSEDDFRNNLEAQDAVVRRFEVIGEAVKNIPREFKDRYPAIPWKEIAGMRDILTHAYFEVDLKRVWNTLKKDIPEFKKQLKNLPQSP